MEGTYRPQTTSQCGRLGLPPFVTNAKGERGKAKEPMDNVKHRKYRPTLGRLRQAVISLIFHSKAFPFSCLLRLHLKGSRDKCSSHSTSSSYNGKEVLQFIIYRFKGGPSRSINHHYIATLHSKRNTATATWSRKHKLFPRTEAP
ncbi:hypothetical protein FNV43_RR04632 [Rhamnella rubrinervis]|uniref:Uncharacterized protein n=1 Tax=Rhamnella rubrinervis TaxID=2594499 RepID=A0A8K0HM57_9ROSA|nr:hypothetical protein FNV43_RR04632 [Rhamnella rubrinervis]